MANTPKTNAPEIAESQASKYITHNEGLRVFDALVQANVIDKDLTEPPGGESDGDTYIVGSTPSAGSAWTGEDDSIAYYSSTAWTFHTPVEGWVVYVQDENAFYKYYGASLGWGKMEEHEVVMNISFDGGTAGAASTPCGMIPCPYDVTIPTNFLGSHARIGTISVSPATFDIFVDRGASAGEELAGTITFTASTTGVLDFDSAFDGVMSAGDYFRIIATGTGVTTLGLGVVIVGDRT